MTTDDTEFTEEGRGGFREASVPCGTKEGIFCEIEKKSRLKNGKEGLFLGKGRGYVRKLGSRGFRAICGDLRPREFLRCFL